MNQPTSIQYIRKSEILKLMGISKSKLYQDINNQLFVPPVSLGARAVAFALHEVQAIQAALLMGKSNEDIKRLVVNLINSRQTFQMGASQ